MSNTRTKSRFLWFPRIINGKIRWLQHASWVQRYQKYTVFDRCIQSRVPYVGWRDTEWIDPQLHLLRDNQ